jgi:YVTN family beta-propeller protein
MPEVYMKRTVILLIALLSASAVFAARANLYVSNNSLKKISVIDTATNEVMNEIKVPCSPKGMKLSPDDQFLYFTGYDTNALYRIRTKNMTVDQDFISVGYAPLGIAVRPDGKKLYVINYKSKNISIVSLPEFEVKDDPVELSAEPKAIIVTDDGRKAYIALSGSDGIALLDLATNRITGVIQTGADPWGMAAADTRIFVTNESLASISVIDTRKNAMINEIVTTDSPRGIAYLGGMLYTAVSNGVDIFETARYEKPASVGLDYPVYGVAAGRAPSGDKIYVAGYDKDSGAGKVAVINPVENEVEAEIEVQGWPMYLEMKRSWPTPAPTKVNTPVPANTPRPTFTPVPRATSTPVPTPAPKPKKKPKKKPTPAPTSVPTPSGLTAALSGRVMMDNSPVQDVKIKALSKHTDKIYTVKTNYAGRFTFDALPIGGYAISVQATYIEEKAVAITVNRGKNPDMTINVKKRAQ